MSSMEAFNIVLLLVIALQLLLTRNMLVNSMKTMRSCCETSQKAFDLAMRVLDGAVIEKAESDELPVTVVGEPRG